MSPSPILTLYIHRSTFGRDVRFWLWSAHVRPLKSVVGSYTDLPSPMLVYSLSAVSIALLLCAVAASFRTPLRFIWNCFFKPFTHSGSDNGQKDRLDAFYSGQADVYDTTRSHLLKGRETMLQLLAAHLKAQPILASPGRSGRKKIWVDIGGGTGWNIEKM